MLPPTVSEALLVHSLPLRPYFRRKLQCSSSVNTWIAGVKIPAERSGCYRVEGDFVAQPFQTPHKTTLDELTIPLIEVIAT
jgi:hypothetical protein